MMPTPLFFFCDKRNKAADSPCIINDKRTTVWGCQTAFDFGDLFDSFRRDSLMYDDYC